MASETHPITTHSRFSPSILSRICIEAWPQIGLTPWWQLLWQARVRADDFRGLSQYNTAQTVYQLPFTTSMEAVAEAPIFWQGFELGTTGEGSVATSPTLQFIRAHQLGQPYVASVEGTQQRFVWWCDEYIVVVGKLCTGIELGKTNQPYHDEELLEGKHGKEGNTSVKRHHQKYAQPSLIKDTNHIVLPTSFRL